jgi:hypothetical protein
MNQRGNSGALPHRFSEVLDSYFSELGVESVPGWLLHIVAGLILPPSLCWQLSIVVSVKFPWSQFIYIMDSAQMLIHGLSIVDQYVLHIT